MNQNHDYLIKILRNHPEREPRSESINQLKTKLRHKAEAMNKKGSILHFLKIASLSFVLLIGIVWSFTESGTEAIRNGVLFILQKDTHTPIIDEENDLEESEEEPQDVMEREEDEEHEDSFRRELLLSLEAYQIPEEAIQVFLHYIDSLINNDIAGIEEYATLGDGDEPSLQILEYYNQHVILESMEVIHVLPGNEYKEITIQIAYLDHTLSDYYIRNKWKKFTYIELLLSEEGYVVIDSILAHNEPIPFTFSEKTLQTYQQIKESGSHAILNNLSPAELVTLFFYVDQQEDDETLYELYVQQEIESIYPSKKEFLEERSRSTIHQTLPREIVDITYFESEYPGNLLVHLIYDEIEEPRGFRLEMEDGLWKVGWMPEQ